MRINNYNYNFLFSFFLVLYIYFIKLNILTVNKYRFYNTMMTIIKIIMYIKENE